MCKTRCISKLTTKDGREFGFVIGIPMVKSEKTKVRRLLLKTFKQLAGRFLIYYKVGLVTNVNKQLQANCIRILTRVQTICAVL